MTPLEVRTSNTWTFVGFSRDASLDRHTSSMRESIETDDLVAAIASAAMPLSPR